MIIVVPKQYRNSRSSTTRQVLPKILQVHEKKNPPTPEFLLKTLFKKKPLCRCLLHEYVETFRNTSNTEHPQRQLSTIIRTNNIFCSIKQTANKQKG